LILKPLELTPIGLSRQMGAQVEKSSLEEVVAEWSVVVGACCWCKPEVDWMSVPHRLAKAAWLAVAEDRTLGLAEGSILLERLVVCKVSTGRCSQLEQRQWCRMGLKWSVKKLLVHLKTGQNKYKPNLLSED
jgi:hypothetical protein